MNLEPRVESWGAGDHTWLGSSHGTDACTTGTLDGKQFESFGKVIPAGVPLKLSIDGTYAPLTKPESEMLRGFLFTAQPNNGGLIVAPILWHGRIILENLPDGIADLKKLTFLGQFTFEGIGVSAGAPTDDHEEA